MSDTARTDVDVDGVIHTVSFDGRTDRGGILQSILLARVVDELTGSPIGGAVHVVSSTPYVRGRAAQFGVCGLVGRPVQAFPLLQGQPYAVGASITAEGYQTAAVTATIPQQPGFPENFTGADIGTIALRRDPVLLTVRTVSLDAQFVPQPLSATVAISGMWRQTADLVNAATAADLVSLDPPVYAGRPVGATVEPVTLTPIVEPARRLLADVAAGDRTIVVDHGGVLAAGDVVSLDRSDPDRAEHVEVASVAAAIDPGSPATLTLRFATRRPHRTSARAERLTVAPDGPPTAALTAAAVPGDVTAFVASMAPFPGATDVRIVSGGTADEFHVARPYSISTGPHGYGQFPLLGRVAAIQLSATAGALAAGPITFTPDYSSTQAGVATNATHMTLT